MDPERETDFVSWLEDKVDEGTKLYGGSATLSRNAVALGNSPSL